MKLNANFYPVQIPNSIILRYGRHFCYTAFKKEGVTMKKFVTAFLLCVMTMLLHFQSALAHQPPVAVIMNFQTLMDGLPI